MPSNVVRDGDTVTVRSCGEPDDMAEIYPDDGVYLLNLSSSTGLLMLNTADLAALAYELLTLAGEPDWKALARKLNRIRRAEYAPNPTEYLYSLWKPALAEITEAEWAALEGAEDGE